MGSSQGVSIGFLQRLMRHIAVVYISFVSLVLLCFCGFIIDCSSCLHGLGVLGILCEVLLGYSYRGGVVKCTESCCTVSSLGHVTLIASAPVGVLPLVQMQTLS